MNTEYLYPKQKYAELQQSLNITKTNLSFRELQFFILEWRSLKYDTSKADHIKMRERWWMWNIMTIHPKDINQFI